MPNQSDQFTLAEFLPYRLAVAAERLSSGMAKRYRSEFGISVAEWRVLVHIADAGSEAVSIRELHDRVHLEKSKASRAASKLEAAGYLTKTVNMQDKRLVALALTQDGQALMQRLRAIAVRYQAQLDHLLAPHMSALDESLRLMQDADL